ncbi:MAG TPA: LysM peptidoglycan-binding domain-containing protein [Chloroflexia bacterium]|nr:LysM peptidoglycan-binding domain-containing protein [Chloroflexia bacterium]
MRLTRLSLFALLLFLGGLLLVFTASVIQWAGSSKEGAGAPGTQSFVPQRSVVMTPSPAVTAIVPTHTQTTVVEPTRAPATNTPSPALSTATPTELPPTATNTPRPTKTPVPIVRYTVRAGDNLISIAARFGTTVDAIMRANNLSSSVIYIGQVLIIPPR